MKIDFELLPPIMPNFLPYKTTAGKRQDGFKQYNHIPVESLHRDEAEAYGELMKETFIKHWENKTKKS